MKGIPATTQGFWSLWQIGMLTLIQRRQRVLPVFVHDDGRNLQPTARFVWDELNTNPWRLDEAIPSADANFPIQQIVVHGALFPFDMTDLSLTALKENPRLNMVPPRPVRDTDRVEHGRGCPKIFQEMR